MELRIPKIFKVNFCYLSSVLSLKANSIFDTYNSVFMSMCLLVASLLMSCGDCQY